MQAYSIEATRSTPEVLLDPDRGLALFRGSSYPENASQFFQPVFDWISTRLQGMRSTGQGGLHLDMQILYFNSSSSKVFLMLFDLLEEAAGEGLEVRVLWRYHPENETAQECGEEFKEDYRHLDFVLQPETSVL